MAKGHFTKKNILRLYFDTDNTSATDQKITDAVTITKGVTTAGLGVVYFYDKINFDAFTGVDFILGNATAQWNYNGRP